MKRAIILVGLAALALFAGPVSAEITSAELQISTEEFGGSSEYQSASIRWEQCHLSLFVGPSNHVSFLYIPPQYDGMPVSLILELMESCPELEMDALPPGLFTPLTTCMQMVAAALESEEAEPELSPKVLEALAAIAGRRFTVQDMESFGSLSLNWQNTYRGAGRIANFSYRDATASLDFEADGDDLLLKLQGWPSSYSAEVRLAGGVLTAKALNWGGEGTPDEAVLLELLRAVVRRAHDLAASDFCGAPEETVDALNRLAQALEEAERFTEYGQLEAPICAT